MLKQFLLKQLVKSQLSKLPPEAQKMIMHIMEKNPELLMNMAQDMQAAKAAGKSDQDAFLALAEKYKDELQKLKQ
jgi:recombinational DNA repair protein RecR